MPFRSRQAADTQLCSEGGGARESWESKADHIVFKECLRCLPFRYGGHPSE